nr:hypothetical protein CFP56_53560 [Quercus suber]
MNWPCPVRLRCPFSSFNIFTPLPSGSGQFPFPSFVRQEDNRTGDAKMELEPSPPAPLVPTRTASGGPRSCMTCAKAKAKCVRVDGERVCQRCARLEKECYMKEPVARRRKIVKPTRAAQLEKLESKIEHLVKALSTKQAGHQPESSQLSPPNSQDDPTSTRVSEVVSALTACDPGCACHGDDHSRAKVSRYIAGLDGGLVQQPHCHMDDFSAVGVTKVEAEMLLQRFRGLMAHSMPFVRIPAETTAQELFDTKPVLLHAIVMVASFHDQTLQQILLKRFMQHIAERTLVNCEKSLSIVQGILVVINW